MQLTILGSSTAAPNPGGANSGYLVRDADQAVLVDCGSGIVGRLRQHVPPNALSAVAISHFHADHFFDLIPLYYSIKFGPPRPAHLPERVPLWVPPGGRTRLGRLARVLDNRRKLFEDLFEVREYVPGGPAHDLGGVAFTFHLVQHYIPSHAMRMQAPDGATLVFSSDLGPCDAIVEAARQADTLLCESALLEPSEDPDQRRRGHTSAGEAGQIAAAAGVRQLVLTHCRRDAGGPLDQRQLAAARAAFAGPVHLADEGRTFEVPPG